MPRNYKTKQCKRFHKDLYCPYGPRCRFLHDKPPTAKQNKQRAVANIVELDAAVPLSYYSDLLKSVEGMSPDVSALPVGLSQKEPESVDAVKDLRVSLAQTSSKRLQVFEDIPDSLSDSQLSIE